MLIISLFLIVGGNDNGRTSWRYNGKTLAEMETEDEKNHNNN